MKAFTHFLSLIVFSLVVFLLNLSTGQASLMLPEKGLLTASELRIVKLEKKIESITRTPFPSMNIKVYGTAVFSNDCLVPNSFVKEYLGKDQHKISIRVLKVNAQDKVCPRIYRPVERTFLIDTIGTTDIMPLIEVNGELL